MVKIACRLVLALLGRAMDGLQEAEYGRLVHCSAEFRGHCCAVHTPQLYPGRYLAHLTPHTLHHLDTATSTQYHTLICLPLCLPFNMSGQHLPTRCRLLRFRGPPILPSPRSAPCAHPALPSNLTPSTFTSTARPPSLHPLPSPLLSPPPSPPSLPSPFHSPVLHQLPRPPLLPPVRQRLPSSPPLPHRPGCQRHRHLRLCRHAHQRPLPQRRLPLAPLHHRRRPTLPPPHLRGVRTAARHHE